jgi:hypothetical protein
LGQVIEVHSPIERAGLEDTLQHSKDAPSELYRLAEALTAVYNHFGPAERSERANAVADGIGIVRLQWQGRTQWMKSNGGLYHHCVWRTRLG